MLQKVGDVYNNFKVTKATFITELQCNFYELVHEPTQAHVLSISNDDPENLFCLSFRTIPETSDGVAHILEHTVLCGSEKFPVKDPFFAMTRRSLNTYMNALTGSDFTCYPAASQVPKDFYNLLDVYLDAVFHPKLKELSFLQEGHRLEFAIPDDPTSPLERKGIVYNEMKGDLSSPTSRLIEAITEALYPDITYGINSGGDPSQIPNLTYQDLLDFHRKFYQPSRCLFYFYGNLPLKGHLDFIEKHILSKSQPMLPLPPIPLQPRFQQPKRLTFSYMVSSDSDMQSKALLGFAWLTCHILDQEETLAISVLDIILMDTDASPLKYALLKSGLCKQVSCYLDADNSEIPLIITLKGCEPDAADALEALIFDTLKKIAQEGISMELVENALHQLELFRSEIQADQSPFGLSLFMRSGLLKQHGANAEEALMIHSLFEHLHKKICDDPEFFSKLIYKYFIDNKHFVRLTMVPDKELAARELVADRMDLDKVRESLSESDVTAILQKTQELSAYQKLLEEEGTEDILPKITLDDVQTENRVYPLQHFVLDNFEVYHHDCFTNSVVYAELVFDMPLVSEEDLFYVRLFTLLSSQVGCGTRNYQQNLEYLQAHTGGVDTHVALNIQAEDHHKFMPYFTIKGKALYRKANKLFELLKEMATSIDFSDVQRLKEVILKHHTALESGLSSSALRYAINLSASGNNIPSKISNAWYGLDYFLKLRKLANNFDAYAHTLVAKLKEFQTHLMCIGTPHLVLSCDAIMLEELTRHRFYGLADLKPKFYTPWSSESYSLHSIESQGRLIASPVAFIGSVFPTVSYVHPDTPALQVAAALFDNLTLHSRIREQGGAYGAGAVSNALAGHFYFYSYRDPNIHQTLKAFEDSIDEILESDFDEEELGESKIEIIQAMDTPISPGSRASVAYSWMREGKLPAVRNAYRERLLSLSVEDVIRAVEKHIVPNFPKSSTVIFSGRELLEKENVLLKASGKKPLPILNIE